jgi:exodeoxyribonuclease V alpha subunit
VPRDAADDRYPGRPLLVTANDYDIGPCKGDTAVVVRTGDIARAAFARGGACVLIPVARLADVQTVHATTVHKGQGSQFDRVPIILPPADSPVLTRTALHRDHPRPIPSASAAPNRPSGRP